MIQCLHKSTKQFLPSTTGGLPFHYLYALPTTLQTGQKQTCHPRICIWTIRFLRIQVHLNTNLLCGLTMMVIRLLFNGDITSDKFSIKNFHLKLSAHKVRYFSPTPWFGLPRIMVLRKMSNIEQITRCRVSLIFNSLFDQIFVV